MLDKLHVGPCELPDMIYDRRSMGKTGRETHDIFMRMKMHGTLTSTELLQCGIRCP